MRIRTITVAVAVASCLPLLASCGGGGGGSPAANMMPDEETPIENEVIMPMDRSASTGWRSNRTAEDLLDHWNDPTVLRDALNLSQVSPTEFGARKTTIDNLLQMAQGQGTGIDNIQADDIEIIGERDGITYGQWKGGPAGTLNIEFDWRFAEDIDTETRARMERAGKSWSYRLMDKNRTRVTPTEWTFFYEEGLFALADIERTLDEAVTTNGVLVFVIDPAANSTGWSAADWYDPYYTPDVLDPWLASLLLSRQHQQDTALMAHEIGHVLGIFPGPDGYPAYDNLVDNADHTFNGPRTIEANEGQPLPFQWLNAQSEYVEPNTPGAEVDYSHPGDCDTIMAYCSDLEVPSELDFAILDDLGYDILDADTASDPELYGYGAWATYSAWSAGVERDLDNTRPISSADRLRAGVNAFGIHPTESFADVHSALEGEVTWMGSLIGIDLGSAKLPPVFGDAELNVNLVTLDGQAMFEGLTVHNGGVSSPFRASTLMYGIAVDGNGFHDESGRISGSFYGPAHEEMAGVLDDRTAEVNLLAGFGGIR